jgi:cyclic pyranopterin phosphate synthase
MENTTLTDRFGRIHDYLRISLTDACNLRCMYCMPDEEFGATPHSRLMSAAEIEGMARIFIGLGIRKIRLTGGEPLVRKDAPDIIRSLSALPVSLSVSTNGVLVDRFIDVFTQANVASVNVSLDTLNAEEFKAITKRGDFDRIMQNIDLLLSRGFRVKVNMVVIRDVNDHAIFDFIRWTRDYPLQVRFIEFMPFSGNRWQWEKVFSLQDILARMESEFEIERLSDAPHDTTKNYRVKGFAGTFGIISTMTAPFCESCNRLRLTADGKIKNCLLSSGELDLLSLYRAGNDIVPVILESLSSKHKERGGRFEFEKDDNRSMIRIGG